MSALQIENRSSDANSSHDYGLADVRAAVLDDHSMTVVMRAAVGILVAVAVAILVAGVATQSLLAVIGGGLATVLMSGALIALLPVPAALTHR